jgi:hypothetical protein
VRRRAAGGTGREAPGPAQAPAPAPALDPDLVPALDRLVPVPTYRDHPATVARDLSGQGPDGRPVAVPVVGTGRWTLLLFLSTDCPGCLPLWEALVDPVAWGLDGDGLVVAVTRDPGQESPAAVDALAAVGTRTVRAESVAGGDLAGTRGGAVAPTLVVMSSAAWSAYRVQGPPFFVLVDGSTSAGPGGEVPVATEGVAWGVAQIAADVRRALPGMGVTPDGAG